MKHKYAHNVTGEQITVFAVELIGPADNCHWIVTLSNGKQMTMHDFTAQYDVVSGIEIYEDLLTHRSAKHEI